MDIRKCANCGEYGYLEEELCPVCRCLEGLKGEEHYRAVEDQPYKTRVLKDFFQRNRFQASAVFLILFIGALIIMLFPPSRFSKVSAGQAPVSSARGNRPGIDVVFVVDSTGSMADEIDVVKGKIMEMMAKIKSGQPKPYVRFGLVSYRDRGDEYVVKSFPLTDEEKKIVDAVNFLEADAGGDTPESVNEALHAAVQEMNWDLNQKTSRILFLIGDAGPHMDYANDYDYRTETASAVKKGIKIFAIGCSGINECGENEFKEIAASSKGEFSYLTYRRQYADASGKIYSVMSAGDKSFVMEDRTGKEWRKGAYENALAGKAKALKPAPACAKAYAAAAPAESYPAYMAYPAGGGSATLKADTISKDAENNLDTIMTEKVMKEAASNGVKY